MAELLKKHDSLKHKVCQYIEKVQSAYIMLPDTRKVSKQSRAQKESHHKDRQRKQHRHEAAVMKFLTLALYPATKEMYFPNGVHLDEDISPLTIWDINPDMLMSLHQNHRPVVVAYLEN